MKKKKIIFLCLIILSVSIIKKKPLEMFVYKFSYGLFYIINSLNNGLQNVSNYTTSKEELFRAIDLLKEANTTLIGQILFFKKIINEEKRTKEIEEQAKIYKKPSLHSIILIKKISPAENIIVINRGYNDGIIKDLPVVYKHFLIGRIYKTYPYHSEVLLISDIRSKVGVSINESEANAIAQGTNNIDCINITFIEEKKELIEGSPISTSGNGLIFPEGLLIGSLKTITKKNELYSNATAQLAFSLNEIKECFVLLDMPLEKKNRDILCFCDLHSIWNIAPLVEKIESLFPEKKNDLIQNQLIESHEKHFFQKKEKEKKEEFDKQSLNQENNAPLDIERKRKRREKKKKRRKEEELPIHKEYLENNQEINYLQDQETKQESLQQENSSECLSNKNTQELDFEYFSA